MFGGTNFADECHVVLTVLNDGAFCTKASKGVIA